MSRKTISVRKAMAFSMMMLAVALVLPVSATAQQRLNSKTPSEKQNKLSSKHTNVENIKYIDSNSSEFEILNQVEKSEDNNKTSLKRKKNKPNASEVLIRDEDFAQEKTITTQTKKTK